MIVIIFHEITLQDKPLFDDTFKRLQFLGSECTFTNLFMWRSCYMIEWALVEGFLLLKVCRNNESFLLPPFGGEIKDLPVVMKKLYEHFGPFEMRGIYRDIIEEIEEVFPNRFTFILDRGNSDYIYRVSNLSTLSGRKYHQKKNHANSFRKTYPDYRYIAMNKDNAKDCIDFAKKWNEKHILTADSKEFAESLKCEMSAITEALTNFDDLDIQGGIITIDGNIEAMTFGEKINNNSAVIHVEKANVDIRGLYPVINQEFCQRAWADLQYINREEDMGLEGLRKAKLSYHPKYLLDKFFTTIDFGE